MTYPIKNPEKNFIVVFLNRAVEIKGIKEGNEKVSSAVSMTLIFHPCFLAKKSATSLIYKEFRGSEPYLR